MANKKQGQTLAFHHPSVSLGQANVAGRKKQGPLADSFDEIDDSDHLGQITWKQAERQYRLPLEYGSQRTPNRATDRHRDWQSCTGRRKITHAAVGKIVGKGITDTNNMEEYKLTLKQMAEFPRCHMFIQTLLADNQLRTSGGNRPQPYSVGHRRFSWFLFLLRWPELPCHHVRLRYLCAGVDRPEKSYTPL